MAKKNLKALAKMMAHLDLCMMTTISKKGMTASRPMSNNGEVEYDGHSYFYSYDKSHLIKDLKADSHVNLSFQGAKDLFVSVSGKAKLHHKREKLKEHWTPDLDKWFKDGVDTKGIVLIEVKAKRIKYWRGQEEGELVL